MTEAIANQSAKEPKRRKRKPASAHQIAVNRANAAKSTGPTSPEGKARSSENSIKHGLCASRFTVVRLEDPAELEELRVNLVHCYRPVNSQELEAIDCMARAQLSMRRAAQLEASLFTSALSESLVDPQIRMEPELQQNVAVSKEQNRGFFLAEGVRKLAREANSLSLMLRYQAHAERQYRRAVEEFERLKKLRPEMPNEPISQQPFPSESKSSEPVTPPPPSGGAGASACQPRPTTEPRPSGSGQHELHNQSPIPRLQPSSEPRPEGEKPRPMERSRRVPPATIQSIKPCPTMTTASGN